VFHVVNIHLAGEESSLIEWIYRLVEDGESSPNRREDEGEVGRNYRQLAYSVVMIWSHIMEGNIQWEIVNIMGLALKEYANHIIY
jgi:hypothetical protein